MTPSIYQQRCRSAATSLAAQAAWPAAVVALGLGAPASLRPNGVLAVTGLFAALIVLGFSIHLAFDAWLFRLMAEHPDESSGGRAVDEILTRLRLKGRPKEGPDAVRGLSDRLNGTQRIVRRQRLALAAFAVLALVAAMQELSKGA